MAFGAVSDVWFVILYTRARMPEANIPVNELPLGLAMFAGAVVAVGLFAYGASLNDVLDARHDTAFSPARPIPAGRIRLGQAVVVTVGSLMIALLMGWVLGGAAFLVTLLTASAILFYNAAGKFIPAAGIVTMGLIHAAHMLIPNVQVSFTLPVWMIMTHAMCVAMSVHKLEDKRPRLNSNAIAAITMGWLFWSAVIVGSGLLGGYGELWPAEVPAIGLIWPVLAAVGFVLVARWKARALPRESAAEKMKRYGAMWEALYGAAWLMTVQLYEEAAWISVFAVAGFVAMTIIREIAGLTGRPIAYRG